jgi:O-antigen biosynthesis protein
MKPRTDTPVAGAALPRRGRVLVIDEMVPHACEGAGYPRSAAIVRLLDAERFDVSFYPLLFPIDDWEQVHRTLPRSIEVLLGRGVAGLEAFLEERFDRFDFVLIHRPSNMNVVMTQLKRSRAAFGRARLIYDAESVCAARELMRRDVLGIPLEAAQASTWLDYELELAAYADHVIAVSSEEARYYALAGKPVAVVGHALAAMPTERRWADRRDLLFVGRLDSETSPNVDGLRWFVESVMPLIVHEEPEIRIAVVGRNDAPTTRALAGDRVHLLGVVDDLTPLYDAARVFIAPTRFAAGLPHKVHEASARGVPAVVTPVLATQLGWTSGDELMVGTDPPAFAAAVLDLYRDESLWMRIREGALRAIVSDCSADAFREGVLSAFA